MTFKLSPIVKVNKEHDFKKYVRWFGYFLWVVVFVLIVVLIIKFFF